MIGLLTIVTFTIEIIGLLRRSGAGNNQNEYFLKYHFTTLTFVYVAS